MAKSEISARVIFKIIGLTGAFSVSFLDYFINIPLRFWVTADARAVLKAQWLRRTSHRVLNIIRVCVHVEGTPPSQGVLVSNHISYIDILVGASIQPATFISKAEVASWPLFGTLAKMGGTLFIQRAVRSDVVRVASEMPAVLKAGLVLVFFPEGTSSGGDAVLPFKPSLLAPAAENAWPVTPSFLRYSIAPEEGTVENDVAYWRDMEFAPHLLNLLNKNTTTATIFYGTTTQAEGNRKELAARLQKEVCQLGGLVVEDEVGV
jgi:1-acyl-sn-glycerol-3-phosphate acyltransferase